MKRAVHLAISTGLLGAEFSQARCQRQGMPSNKRTPCTVTVTTAPADVTCKDCRRLAKLDERRPPQSALPGFQSRRMAGDWR